GHLVQMVGLAVQNFLSAATGIALAIALIRAFARSGAATVGNFWVDMARATLYILLPISILLALAFALSGMPQTLQGSVDATTLEGAKPLAISNTEAAAVWWMKVLTFLKRQQVAAARRQWPAR